MVVTLMKVDMVVSLVSVNIIVIDVVVVAVAMAVAVYNSVKRRRRTLGPNPLCQHILMEAARQSLSSLTLPNK